MAYGISINNNNNHKIIQDQNPIYALKRSGTLSQYQTTNQGSAPYYPTHEHAYGYLVQNTAADPTGTEDIFFKLDVGQWISYWPFQLFLSDGQTSAYTTLALSDFTSNRSTSINYYIFDRMNQITGAGAASGYGMQVFDTSGSCMWDSNEITNRVSYGAQITSTTTINTTANAVSMRQWYIAVYPSIGFARGGANPLYGWRCRRVSTSSWVVEIDYVDAGFYPYQGEWYGLSGSTNPLVNGNARVLFAYV